ncbi:hypothetical protein Fmac_010516 [Flemingia macrophylla]|uniref:AAA+ ATPase domain-containing protein n=1 Tax=Flemingia macrophylla TaxID=520843 RepID=A0ABD1MJU3_9FABA
METVLEIVDNVIAYVLRPVCKQVGYIVHYKQNVHELNGSCDHLGCEKERLEHHVDEAHKNLQNIEGKVTKWLLEVSEFESEFEKFKNDEGHTKLRFPHLWNRHRLGRRAKKMTMQVKNLVDESPKSDEVAYKENVTSNVVTLSNVGYMEFGSRNSTMNDILAQLQDSTVKMIGLHGPGGVGKTTFVKEIAKKARNKRLFDVVARVEITANPNLQKIQEDIAYVLGLRLERDGENIRADCLRRRLKKKKENTLIILDDLWDKLDLNKLGIPLDDALDDEDDDYHSKMNKSEERNNDYQDPKHKVMKKEKPPNEYKGCKILLTSRDKNVLSDKMEVKSIFCIKELDDDDALMLFQKVVGTSNEMSKFKQEIVKKYCEGIPMAIITVGRALRNKNESVWEARLEKLKKQELVGVQKPMEISLKMNYDHLENEELKSIFLLCAQMGHQPQIMDLVKYSFGLGILEGVYSLMEARERVHTLIQKLVDSNLVVLDGSSNDHFNMHDMVRDAALSIAHKEKNVFTMRNGKVDDWLELEQCTSISICNSDIIDELPNTINCPQLKFFRIDNDGPFLEIHEHFFEGMKNLRVLILSGFHLSNVENLFKYLSNLRMLCLERCNLDANLSIIGELKKIRIISFSGSQIQNFPAELGCLYRLQSLDISNCYIERIYLPFISKLTSLEELYIRKSLINFVVVEETSKGQTKGQKSFLFELKHLHQLKVVDLSVLCAAFFPKELFFNNLHDYKIVIGDIKVLSHGDFRMPNKYEPVRSLALQLETDNIHFLKGIKFLFKTVQNLLLGEISGVKNDIYELNLDGFPDLKHLSITNNFSIEYLFNSMGSTPPVDVFSNLEYLCLYKLWNIKMICSGPVPDASFTKLKTIKIKICAHLKNIISSYMVKFLSSLETIDVSDCDSIEEIVEIPEKSNKVELPKLQYLTLQSLPPSFASFYSRVKENIAPSLFGELVNIPNLESLNLSSINIHKIWCNQSLSSFCFQNLIKLVVKDCNKLRYLCSLSVASGLNMLKSLHVSGCHVMEKIFCVEGNGVDKAFVFPKLEEIHLNKMSMLIDIWQVEMSADSFCSLISVHIEKCIKLDKIFPSHIEGWYESLENLKVIDCPLMKVIFEIKDSQLRDAYGGIDTNLQSVFLNELPKLKQVWSIDPKGILNFKKLQSIDVSYCNKLRNVFPASVAKDVQKIEYISVTSCDRMVEIVAREDGLEASNEPLVFPELTNMELCYSENMKCFCVGRHAIKCPKLNKLTIMYWEKLEIFHTTSESTNKEIAVFSTPEKVFSNLEYMKIGFKEASNWLRSDTDNYIMYRLKELIIFGNNNDKEIDLYQFLYRMPNLEKLSLSWLAPSANITEQQELETVLQLKDLVFSWSRIGDIGFAVNPVLRSLELLILIHCNNLIIIAPSSVSLTYLTYLEVKDCNGLKNLMASSTAKSLVQLKTMKVINCWQIKEIVIGEGDQEDNKVTEILFSKLITIELVNLKHLTSFCSHKNCIFKFPSLEILIVTECFMMETFSKNLTSAPKLENIFAVEGDGEATWQWEHDLNATIQKVFNDKTSFRYSEYLDLSKYPELIGQLWLRPCACRLQNNFGNLKRMEAWGCDSLPQVIPSHLLACFENLEELKVHSCSETEVIFNITDEMREQQRKTLGIIRLKRLILLYLPKLQHVWDKDPEGIIDLQVLRVMSVERCNCLRSLFPAIVAKKDLTLRLEKLKVTECNELVEIFSKGAEEKEEATKKLVLSCLRSLTLRELPRLKYLYRGVERAECDGEEQLLIQIHKVIEIPSLNKLSLDIGDVQVTRDRELLLFESGKDFEDLLDSSAPLSHMFPNIQKFVFSDCGFEEIFSAERPIYADYTLGLLLNIKGLVIHDMWDLKSIGLEQSWLQPFPQNLQKLQVIECSELTKLVPSGCTVYFSNLTHLKVSRCWRLLYLFTSSTAKSLGRLKRLQITECGSLKEIVSAENESDDEDKEIIFEQLQVLYLKTLDELSCFYFGNWTLHFPCLEEVYLIDCNRMKSFSRHNRIDNSTEYECYTEEDGTPQQCSSDLNSTVQRILEEKLSMSKHLTIGGVNELEIIQGNILHSLELLTFLDFDEFPYEFLKQMPNIEKLEVRESRFKEIFCLENPNIDEFLSQLEGLGLESLPNLVSIGFENLVPSIASFSNLMDLKVYSCNELLYLFTYSTAKSLGQLKTIQIASCESIKEIVVCDKEGGESNEDEIIFPHLKCLTLYRLRKLRSFYEGSVNFPSLDQLMIEECDIMESLCGGTIKAEKLSQVKLEYIDIQLKTDLNSTLMNVFLEKTSSLDIGNKPKLVLQEIWLGLVSIPNTCFRNLISLMVDGCRFLSDAVLPFHLLPLFTNLEALQVRNCDYVKTVFDVKRVKQDSKFPLRKLTLSKLPNLENVWNKDPQGVLKMQPLCEVEVDNCKRLTNVFPASVANDIEKLENLVVKHCEEFMTIVAKDDAYQRETFSYVKSLTLCDLPKFKYSDTCFIHDATTSKLEHLTLDVNELKKILHEEFLENLLPEFKVFALLFQHKSDEFVQQVSDVEKLVVCDDSFKEIFCRPELKVLRWKSLRELVSVGSKNSWFESFLIGNIKSFEVISCFSSASSLVSCTVSFSNLTHLEVNKCKGLIYLLTSSTAKSLVQLETMEIIDCDSVEEIIVCNKEGDESTEEKIIFPHLNCLTLNGLPKLSSFYKGSLGFPMLDQLKVTNCDVLKYLLTSSTAKSLVQLKTMEIERCDSIEEIIVCNKEGDESTEDEIIFLHLNCLTLIGLPKLRSFYKGSLGFPSLDQLKVTKCYVLKYLLTSSTAKSLVQLKTMEIQRCSSIIELIVCNRKRDEPNEDEIIFPHLNCLTLEYLPKLTKFYKWSLSFPSLDEHNLTVSYCPRMRTDLKSLMGKRKA